MHFFPSTPFDSTSHPEGTRMSTPMPAMAATPVGLVLLLCKKTKKQTI